MRMSESEKDLGSKKEVEGHDEKKTITPSCSSSSRKWTSSFKNPRIVRVSRGFGCKDRHSKVCTVRGLRDRRIRLSVPTAIQLYNLQDRLGLSQPSKVIDWLMDATKHEIDKLPPLPMLPTNFLHNFHQPSSVLANPHDQYLSPYTVSDHHHHLLSPKDRERWIGSSQNSDGEGGFGGFAAHNFFPLNSQFSVPNLPYNSDYFQLETCPSLSLSQFGGGFSFSDRTDPHHHQQQQQSNYSLSSWSASSQASSSQIYMCPSATSITPPFASYMTTPPLENEQFIRPINHLQNSVLMPTTLHLINPPLRSFSFNPSLHSNQHEIGKQSEDGSS